MHRTRKIQLASAAVIASGIFALIGLGHSPIAAAACQSGNRCLPMAYQTCIDLTQAQRASDCSRYVPSGCTLETPVQCLDDTVLCDNPFFTGLLCAWH